MKITRKDINETRVELTITLAKKELDAAEQVALVHMSQDVKIPGFRKGKAPASVVKKNVKQEDLHSHILGDAVNRAVAEAFSQQSLQALDRPAVEVKKYVPEQELEFTAEAEVLPPIALGDYKKLKATASKITVTKKDIDEVIERMRASFAEKKAVKRAAKDGDEATIDFKGFDEKGEAFAGGDGKDYPLQIGSNTFIPGFEEGIIGKKTGDNFDLPIVFPKDYHAKHLAGAKTKFEVSIKAVKEVVLPKVDDEFAAKCGPFTSVEDLQTDIKSEIRVQRENEAKEKLKDELVEQLVGATNPSVPGVLIDDQIKNIETDFVQNLAARGMTLDQYLEDKSWTEEQWREGDLRDAAVRRVQSAMVLSEVSKLEKIAVTDEEINARHQQMLEQYPDPSIRAQLETNEARNDIANRLLTEKTLERLVEINT